MLLLQIRRRAGAPGCPRHSCFFFKQKTAYDLRISDWSSDVCSSDLNLAQGRLRPPPSRGRRFLLGRLEPRPDRQMVRCARGECALMDARIDRFEIGGRKDPVELRDGAAAVEAVAGIDEIGRAHV